MNGDFGPLFKGPEIPFGAMVEYFPISATDQSWLHQFGKRVLPGIFLGYALIAGGIWIGDILFAGKLESWENWTREKSTLERLNAKEILTPEKN